MKLKTVAILVSASFLISACNDSDDDSGEKVTFEAGNLLDRAANDVITKSYDELDTKAEELVTEVEALDDGDATGEKVEAAREQWETTRKKWEATEAYLFGPVDTGGHDPAMDSWPLDKAYFDDDDSEDDFEVPNDFDDVDGARKGFHAVEYLLWNRLITDSGGEESAKEAADRLNGKKTQREYLVAAAEDVRSHTQ
ncbi:imelysin family protein, partial [Thiohalospira sp.]|uniref:imelysin family protein n=1 Tax=Thiohalospira sp. TaxID=3080549 RepID=UPI00397EFF0B